MKKLLALITTTLLIIACGDDNSTSVLEVPTNSSIGSSDSKTASSSNGNSPEADWITIEKTDHFSFFDEKYLRYYFLEEECDYDSTTNSFKWVTEDYTGVFDRYDISSATFQSEYGGDSIKYMIDRSFGFKLSNDTLYECDYIGDKCDDPHAASVYVGKSNSIFSTWELVGAIKNGTYEPKPSNYKTTLILEPTQRTIKTSLKDIYKLYAPRDYCYQIYQIFDNESKEKLCRNYFTENQNVSSDTAFIASGLWFLQKDSNTVNISVDGKIIEISTTLSVGMHPTQYTSTIKKVSYQGTTCTKWTKNLDITQQYCEATEHDMDFLKKEYSNIHHTFVDQLLSYSDNNVEVEECVKQFNLK